MRAVYYTEKDKLAYEKFIRNSKEATIFHTLDWKHIIESSFPYKPRYLLAKENNIIKAVLPLFEVKTFTKCRLVSLPFSTYGGVIGDSKGKNCIIKKIIDLKNTMPYDSILIKQPPDNGDTLFTRHHFMKHENRWNQYLRITKPNELWNNIKKSNRTAIRQGIKHGLTLKKGTSHDDLIKFYTLDVLTRHRTGFLPLPLTFYTTMWDTLHPLGRCDILSVNYQGQVIASTICIKYRKNIVCGYAASDIERWEFRPNNYLIWKAIELGYIKHCDMFDLGMTLKNNDGLHFFKSSFTTSEISYGHYYYPKTVTVTENKIVNRIGEKMIRYFPMFIYKQIGKTLVDRYC